MLSVEVGWVVRLHQFNMIFPAIMKFLNHAWVVNKIDSHKLEMIGMLHGGAAVFGDAKTLLPASYV